MRLRLTSIALIAMSTAARAEGVDLSYENFRRTPSGSIEIVLKFTNNTGTPLRHISAECAMLGKDKKAITVITVAVSNVPPGGVAYGKNYAIPGDGIENAQCRVDN